MNTETTPLRIAELRHSKNMTQAQLAENLNIERPRLAMWETGKSSPRAVFIPAIARALGCGIGELFEQECEG